MKKIPQNLFSIFIFCLSFFVAIKTVNAVQYGLVDNLATDSYLNLYALDFSDNPLANTLLYKLQKSNYDIKNILRENGALPSSFYERYNDIIVSLRPYNGYLKYDNPSDEYYTDYKFLKEDYNGEELYYIDFWVYHPRLITSYVKFRVENGLFNLTIPIDRSYHISRCKIYFDEYSYTSFKAFCYDPFLNVANEPITSTTSFTELLMSYYQGQPLFLPEETASQPHGIVGLRHYQRGISYSTLLLEDPLVNFLGASYFRENLFFGGGQPLYPSYSYFTNTFEYGDPYNDDYGVARIYSNTQCYFTLKEPLWSDYENIHSQGLDKFYVKTNDTASDIKTELWVFSNQDYVTSNTELNGEVPDNLKNHVKYSEFNSTKTLKAFNPDVFGKDSYVAVMHDLGVGWDTNVTITPSSAYLSVYYKKEYWNYSCGIFGNPITITDADGNDQTFIPGSHNNDDDNELFDFFSWLMAPIEFIYNSFKFVADTVSNLFSSIGSLGTYLQNAINGISQFLSPIGMIGSGFTSLFNSMPSIMQVLIVTVFTISMLGIVLKLIV